MLRRSPQVQGLRRIRHPHRTATGARLPKYLSFYQPNSLFIAHRSERPLAAPEIIVTAGKVYWQQLTRLQKLNLPPVNLLAQRIDHRRLSVFRFQRWHYLAHRGRDVHRHRSMQALRRLQPDIAMQHPKIRPRSGLVKRPLQIKGERQSAQAHVDFRPSISVSFYAHIAFLPTSNQSSRTFVSCTVEASPSAERFIPQLPS